MENLTPRGMILEEARRLTEGDRNKAHGDPEPNMHCFSKLIEAYLNGTGWNPDYQLDSVDASIICCLLKISRIAANHMHNDSYIDLAAYAAIAGECAGVYKNEPPKQPI